MNGWRPLLSHLKALDRKHRAAMVEACFVFVVVACLVSVSFPGNEVWAQSPRMDPPLRPLWETVFPGEQSVRAMLVEGGVAYLLTGEGIIHALSAGDGKPLWQTSGWLAPEAKRCPYDPPQMQSLANYSPMPMPGILLALDSDLLVATLCAGWEGFSADQQLLLLDRTTGQIRGSLPVIGGRLMSVRNGVAVISSEEGPYAVSLRDGREVWRIKPEDKYNFYFMGTFDDLGFVKIYDENYRAIVHALSTTDGATRWTLPPGDNPSFKAIVGGVLFAFYEEEGTYRSSLQALDPQNGAGFWQAELGILSDRYSNSLRLTVLNGRVYAYSDSQPGGMIALNAATGSMDWEAVENLGITGMQVMGSVIYCVANDGEDTSLYALNNSDGQVIWSGLSDSSLTLGPVVDQILLVAASAPGVSGDDAVLSAFQERM